MPSTRQASATYVCFNEGIFNINKILAFAYVAFTTWHRRAFVRVSPLYKVYSQKNQSVSFQQISCFPNFLQKQTKPCMPRVFAIVSNELRAEEGVWRSVLGAVGHRNMLVTKLFAPQSPYLRSGGTEGDVSRGPTLLR